MNLFDIPWEDVLISHVVPYLEIEDLFNLRLCSKQCEKFVDLSLQLLRKCELIFQEEYLPVLTANCHNLLELDYDGRIDDHLFKILLNNPNMTILSMNLDFYDVPQIKLKDKEHELITAILSLHKLENFYLNTSYQMKEMVLMRILRYLPKLKIIEASSYYSDIVIMTIVMYCRNIEQLNLLYARFVTESGIG